MADHADSRRLGTGSSPQRVSASKWNGMPWLKLSALVVLLHYLWEMFQAPLFANLQNVPVSRHAVTCLGASLGDLGIAAVAYLGTAAAFRNLYWPVSKKWIPPAIVWIAIGIAITVVVELWALSAGRWSYGEQMPTIYGIGLSPLAQWIIVPAVILLLLRSRLLRIRSIPEPGGRTHY